MNIYAPITCYEVDLRTTTLEQALKLIESITTPEQKGVMTRRTERAYRGHASRREKRKAENLKALPQSQPVSVF